MGIIAYTPEGVEVALPLKRVVCDRCGGTGSHVNPNIDGNGLSASDFADDPEFEEAYFNGAYDVRCESCQGRNVVDVIDYDAITSEEQKLALAEYEREQNEEAAYRRMRRQGIQF